MKNETKHTQGEWFLEDRRGVASLSGNEGNIDVYASVLWIATVHGSHVGPQDPSEAEANARLIAAAPELLEALERASAWLDVLDESGIASNKSDTLGDSIEMVRAAIAKAKGEA